MIFKDIEDFSALTDFIEVEYDKMSESFGVKNASESMINFIEKSLKKYFKLHNKPFYRMAKRELKLKEAIDTMPHGKVWRFFHSNLWAKIQERYGETKNFKKKEPENEPQEKPISLPAEIIKKYDLPQLSEGEISSSTAQKFL